MKKEKLLNWCNPINAVNTTIKKCFQIINSDLKFNLKLLYLETEINNLKNNIAKFYEILLAFDSHWSNDYHAAKERYGTEYLSIRNVLKKRENYYNKLNNKISNLEDTPIPNIFQLYSFLKNTPDICSSFKYSEYYIEMERKLYLKSTNSEILNEFWKKYHRLNSRNKIEVIKNILSRYNGLIRMLNLTKKTKAKYILSSYENNEYKQREVKHNLIKIVCSNWECIKNEIT